MPFGSGRWDSELFAPDVASFQENIVSRLEGGFVDLVDTFPGLGFGGSRVRVISRVGNIVSCGLGVRSLDPKNQDCREDDSESSFFAHFFTALNREFANPRFYDSIFGVFSFSTPQFWQENREKSTPIISLKCKMQSEKLQFTVQSFILKFSILNFQSTMNFQFNNFQLLLFSELMIF